MKFVVLYLGLLIKFLFRIAWQCIHHTHRHMQSQTTSRWYRKSTTSVPKYHSLLQDDLQATWTQRTLHWSHTKYNYHHINITTMQVHPLQSALVRQRFCANNHHDSQLKCCQWLSLFWFFFRFSSIIVSLDLGSVTDFSNFIQLDFSFLFTITQSTQYWTIVGWRKVYYFILSARWRLDLQLL